MVASSSAYSLDELCALASLPRRTVRYYIQRGLVDRPVGETRAAYYTEKHLRQLLQIRNWSEAGLSLEAIGGLLADEATEPPLPRPTVGSVTVRSHLSVAPGIELVVDPGEAGMDPDGLRQLFTVIKKAHQDIVARAGDATAKQTQEKRR